MVEPFSSLVEKIRSWSPRTLAMPIQILHIPLCISLQMPVKLFGQHETLHLMNKNRRAMWNYGNDTMTKRKACDDCILKDYCPGVQSRYIRHFGWDEFQPVKEEQWNDFLSRSATETMLPDDDVRHLIAPFNEAKPIGGWLLESIENRFQDDQAPLQASQWEFIGTGARRTQPEPGIRQQRTLCHLFRWRYHTPGTGEIPENHRARHSAKRSTLMPAKRQCRE